MKVRYTRQAFRDRERILDYLETRSRSGARNVKTRLDSAVVLLSEQPTAGTVTDVLNVRVLFVGHYPYKIFYPVKTGTIEILHIRHTSRRPSEYI
ncbi:type II toxin-antitoxin system RelE/ParE family toxin [Chelativorans xinjiangense]|uniref:type II toxin-antitoxin system RelE/ParE family toxin n=1 Tax=Chelativorans xinjiangense TaxID=2681485 RepID=UPI00135BB428|nr:type II toxin-antitoxin system RelE/ParE family toxin [Chelativorans xinjiangense]